MPRKIIFALSLLLFCITAPAQERALSAGMTLSKSAKIRKAVYALGAPRDTAGALIIIEGNNLIIDFNGAELKGSPGAGRPDEFYGVALLVRNSRNVTIKNLKARGYKVALLARNVERLTLDNCDFSYNYRPQLNSTQEKEDISDWMSYHHNEKDEWLRYGAAIYLRGCHFSVIRNCKVTGGQNALMMTECNDGKIYNNDFSFNSGIGLGMYRCSRNEVAYNRINFNVRGYSHGVYNRGQDSAGILVYEQSHNNIFYKNSVTHGGDGFFLWAGQTTMDTGKGGCNDNLLWGNDFSYAPTNGVELTFSRNRISGNRIFECDHGIWGGYSFESLIDDNQFRNNRIGIAIEHGQQNRVLHNLFTGDREAIKLWSNKTQPSDWGYAKYRDTRSAGYQVMLNSFNSNPVAISITRSDSINIYGNTYSGMGIRLRADSTVTHIDSVSIEWADTTLVAPVIKNPIDPFRGNAKLAGRNNILITEWGPYDFRSPVIWNSNPTDTSETMQFDLLAPAGKWKIISARGVEAISDSSGEFPARITAKKIRSDLTDILIELDYTGPAITTPFGEKIPAGKVYGFSYRKYFHPMDWQVQFFSLDTAQYNPIRKGALFPPSAGTANEPFKNERVKQLDYAWWGGIKASGKQHTQFMTVAAATAEFKPGEYEISVTWDDAVRVLIDDRLLIDEWNPSLYVFDESPHKKFRVRLDGNHRFRVEHLELGGFATLSLKIKPVE